MTLEDGGTRFFDIDIEDKDMKFTNPVADIVTTTQIAGTLNVFSLLGISLTWGHMLGLITLWFLPVTALCVMIGYGSEMRKKA